MYKKLIINKMTQTKDIKDTKDTKDVKNNKNTILPIKKFQPNEINGGKSVIMIARRNSGICWFPHKTRIDIENNLRYGTKR